MSGSDPARPAGGFTLLELLVVLSVIAILIAAAPRLAPAPGGGLRDAVGLVAGELRLARERALTGGAAAGVGFDLPGRRLLREDGAAHPLPAGVEIALETAVEARDALGAPGVLFFPEGGATGGEIAVARGEARGLVAVRWLTGAVDVR